MDKNVQIPLSLLKKIVDLLCIWNTYCYDDSVKADHEEVLDALYHKMQRIDLRQAYSKIIHAKTEVDRFNARLEYLEQRRMLKNPF